MDYSFKKPGILVIIFHHYHTPADYVLGSSDIFSLRSSVNKVLIYNLQGKLVYNQTFKEVSDEISLNPNLSHGFYMVKIQSGVKSTVQKLIIR